jgi:hypothetical protein
MPGSLSDLKEIGCKSAWAAHISPLFWSIERLLTCKTGKICPHPAEFSLRFFKSDRLLDFFLDFGGDIVNTAISAPALFWRPRVIGTRACPPNTPGKTPPLDSAPPFLREQPFIARGNWLCSLSRAMMREHERGQASLADNHRRAEVADWFNVYGIHWCRWRRWNTGDIAHHNLSVSNTVRATLPNDFAGSSKRSAQPEACITPSRQASTMVHISRA